MLPTRLEQFADFCLTKNANETFVYIDCNSCAAAQFYRSIGETYNPSPITLELLNTIRRNTPLPKYYRQVDTLEIEACACLAYEGGMERTRTWGYAFANAVKLLKAKGINYEPNLDHYADDNNTCENSHAPFLSDMIFGFTVAAIAFTVWLLGNLLLRSLI
jgi:hypothetical protein